MCIIEVSIQKHDKFYSDPWVVCVLSFISLLMWMKMGYFLRLFQRFAYLINMILRVIKDMVSFLVVMAIGLAAFTEGFMIVSDSITLDSSKPGEVGFAGSTVHAIFYVYRMALGDFDFGDFEGEALTMYYLWFLFFLCTMFNMIIMLNLLIAIISESFAAVNATQEQTSYQEISNLIAENQFLVPPGVKSRRFQPDTYLFLVEDTLKKETSSEYSSDNSAALFRRQISELIQN